MPVFRPLTRKIDAVVIELPGSLKFALVQLEPMRLQFSSIYFRFVPAGMLVPDLVPVSRPSPSVPAHRYH